MAYIGQVSIRDTSHMQNAIDYVSREDKALPLKTFKEELEKRIDHMQNIDSSIGERATYINCNPQNTSKEFELIRKAFNKNKGVIAHHYFQSFQKDDDITPEQAHDIGIQLAKKMFQNYQVVIATHIDKEHIHNHFIVNSCNIQTGQKWYSNKKSLSDIRNESDKLCLQNGFGVIEKESKYKSIDKTTYQLGLKCKSWKINLVHDLDQAVLKCKSKEEFISYLKEHDYTVRYKDIHITIKKNGEKKGIRVNTLARQFGDKYTKENLEKKMGFYISPAINQEKTYPQTYQSKSVKSNWEYYEQRTFRQRNYYKSDMNHVIRNERSESLVRSAERSLFYSKNVFELIIKAIILAIAYTGQSSKKQKTKKYNVINHSINEHAVHYNNFGNIDYRKLTESSGDNFSIKVNAAYLLKLANQPLFHYAVIDQKTGTATITVKAKDKDFLSKLLNINIKQEELDNQNEKISNKVLYDKIKKTAKLNNENIQYLVITETQLKILKENYIPIAYFKKSSKFNIAFLPDKSQVIKKLLFSTCVNKENDVQKNIHMYNSLKQKATQKGVKLKYRAKITKQQLKMLSESNIEFAYFINSEDNSLYNIAFDEDSSLQINSILKQKNISNSNLK
ncbi:MAG: relaxase/mobilization nuclease domain-containing protein [Oscillospiraceae bacterium]|nr:relaxase/mobilization nuclease domain-containing protein [Oscillospiraceae bacterium]